MRLGVEGRVMRRDGDLQSAGDFWSKKPGPVDQQENNEFFLAKRPSWNDGRFASRPCDLQTVEDQCRRPQ